MRLDQKMNDNAMINFLLFCSGANKQILEQCPTDINKYVGVGGTVFFTGLFAMLSGGYAFYTVFHTNDYALVPAMLLGILWGLFIFNLDRYIVSSMHKQGKPWNDLKLALPRLILAVLLALVISKPLELRLFETEIESELISMEQRIFKTQEDSIGARYQPQVEALISQFEPDINRLTDDIKNQRQKLAEKEAIRDERVRQVQEEVDGKSGRPPGCGSVCEDKKEILKKAEQEVNELQKFIAQQQTQLDEKKRLLDDKREKLSSLETNDFNQLRGERKKYRGLAARLEAFSNLTTNNPSVSQANLFIMLLFIVIETAPIFVKLISHKGPYDEYLEKIITATPMPEPISVSKQKPEPRPNNSQKNHWIEKHQATIQANENRANLENKTL